MRKHLYGVVAMILCTVLFSACAKKPESSQSVGREFVVEKLFTHEGCTVNRFYDHGYARYFTNCSSSTSWSRTESHGKTSSTYHEGVEGTSQ